MSFDRIRKLIKNANASVDATTTEYGTENKIMKEQENLS